MPEYFDLPTEIRLLILQSALGDWEVICERDGAITDIGTQTLALVSKQMKNDLVAWRTTRGRRDRYAWAVCGLRAMLNFEWARTIRVSITNRDDCAASLEDVIQWKNLSTLLLDLAGTDIQDTWVEGEALDVKIERRRKNLTTTITITRHEPFASSSSPHFALSSRYTPKLQKS